MVSFREVFKKYLRDSKRTVETQMSIQLGEIGIYPFWQYGILEFGWDTKKSALYNIRQIKSSLLKHEKNPSVKFLWSRVGNKGIYYPKSHLTRDLSEDEAHTTLLAGLYNIALPKIKGFDDIHRSDISELVQSSFSEYMALKTMKKYGPGTRKGNIKDEIHWVTYEVELAGLEFPRHIADYMLSLDRKGAQKRYEQYLKRRR